jgi:hypothetical protein
MNPFIVEYFADFETIIPDNNTFPFKRAFLGLVAEFLADITVPEPEYLSIEPVSNRRYRRTDDDTDDGSGFSSGSASVEDWEEHNTASPSAESPPAEPMHTNGNILVKVKFDDPVIQERLAGLACVDWTITVEGLDVHGKVTASGTLCPTAAPTSSSPTASPTASPTGSPSPAPSTSPSTSPSQVPPLLNFETDSAQSGAEESNSAAEASIAGVAAALLLVMVLLGIVVQRRQRQSPKEGAEEPGFDELPAAGASKLENISAGIAVVVPALIAKTSAGNRLWSDFRRVVSFDVLYYENPIMKLDDLALHDVYALLAISCPPSAYLDNLRTVGGRWLNLPISKSNEEDLVNDAADFFMAAMPDCLVERAIDLLALSKLQEGPEDTEALYALVDELFSGPNAFLVRDTSGNAQMNPYAAIREVHCPEPEYFEAENDGTEGVYQFESDVGLGGDKSGRHYFGAAEIFAETPFAAAPASNDYDLVYGETDDDPTYDMAASKPAENNYSLGSAPEENNYSLGSAPEENNYSLGSAPEENNYSLGSAPEENNYSLGSAPEENNYSLGSASDERTYGVRPETSGHENTYSLGLAEANESTDDTYTMADAVGIRATESTDDGEPIYGLASSGGNTYSLGSFGAATGSTADGELLYGLDGEPLYGLGGTGGGGLQFKCADGRGAAEVIYETAGSSSDDAAVIVPAAYDTGTLDQTYGNHDATDNIYGNPRATNDMEDQLQFQFEQAAQFLTSGSKSSADLLWGEDNTTVRTGETAALGYVTFTPGGDVDCDSDDSVEQGSSAYVTCLGADGVLDSLPGDLQPRSVTVDYMECVPDGRESPFATPKPVDTSEAPTSPESTDIPKSRWKGLGKWRKGKDKSKTHKDVPSPSLGVVQLDKNVVLADSGSGRKLLDFRGSSVGSLDIDDDDLSLDTSSVEGRVFDELRNPYFLSDSLTAGGDDPTSELSRTSTLTMDPKLGIRFKSMHRSNPLASLGDDSADVDTDESMADQQAESPAKVGSDHSITAAKVGSDHSITAGRTKSYFDLFETSESNPLKDSQENSPNRSSSMDDLLKLSDAALASGTDIDAVIAEAEAADRRSSYNEIVRGGTAEDTEATFTPTPTPKTENEGTRPWNFSIGRFSKRISRRDGKDLRTPTDISAPTRRLPVALEPDNVADATDCGYIENGNTNPREDLATEHDLRLGSESVDAEWKDIHQFLSTVVADSVVEADADNTDPLDVPLGSIEELGVAGQQLEASDPRYSPNFQAAIKRHGSRRTSLI